MSHSSSSKSNLLNFSSNSSNISQTIRTKKSTQSSQFVHKINSLFDQNYPDLDALYLKIQKLATNQVYSHATHQFKSILKLVNSLKGNHKKIAKIAALLHKQIQNQQPNSIPDNQYLDGKITMSTHKQSHQLKHITQDDHVHTSIQYNHEHKPSFKKKKKPQDIDLGTQSPSSSFQQYRQRNQYYEQKISSMIQDLKNIKSQISTSPIKQPPVHSHPSQNDPITQESIIGLVDQKHFQSSQPSLHPISQSKDLVLTSGDFKEPSNLFSFSQIQQNVSKSSQAKEKKQFLLNYTTNLTKKIEKLKEATAKLHQTQINSKESSLSIIPEASISETKINELIRRDSEEKAKRPILQLISNASSKIQISSQTIQDKNQNQETKETQDITNTHERKLSIEKQNQMTFVANSIEQPPLLEHPANTIEIINNNNSIHHNISTIPANISSTIKPNHSFFNPQQFNSQRSFHQQNQMLSHQPDQKFHKDNVPAHFLRQHSIQPSNLFLSQQFPNELRTHSASNRSGHHANIYMENNSIMKYNQLRPFQSQKPSHPIIVDRPQISQNITASSLKKTGINLHQQSLKFENHPSSRNQQHIVVSFQKPSSHDISNENHIKSLDFKKKGIHLLGSPKQS